MKKNCACNSLCQSVIVYCIMVLVVVARNEMVARKMHLLNARIYLQLTHFLYSTMNANCLVTPQLEPPSSLLILYSVTQCTQNVAVICMPIQSPTYLHAVERILYFILCQVKMYLLSAITFTGNNIGKSTLI